MMRVIKIGGRVQGDSRLAEALALAWSRGPGELCVVHGGGDEITALQGKFGITPSFVEGRRVTSAADIDFIRMALSGSANKRLVSSLISAGALAVGLSGEDAAIIQADVVDRERLGEVGDPVRIDPTVLVHLTRCGLMPVVSPVGRSTEDGAALNINGDDAAAALAVALEADELLFVADVPGVLAGGTVVESLGITEARALVQRGEATGGMLAKLQAAARAIDGGVTQVRIGDLSAIADVGAGTRIHAHASSFA
jgi:acetylglutamate kinase